jgi:hypothetical protein
LLVPDVELGLAGVKNNTTIQSNHYNNYNPHHYQQPPAPQPNDYNPHHYQPPPRRQAQAGNNAFDSLPDEVLLEVFAWLPSFRDKMALQATDRRWRVVAAGDNAFAAEHDKRAAKGRWYHEEMRGRAKREREARSKQRTAEWHQERKRELERERAAGIETNLTPEQIAVKRRRDMVKLVLFLVLVVLLAMSMFSFAIFR